MVDVIHVPLPGAERQSVADGVNVIQRLKDHLAFVDVLVEFAVNTEPPYFAQPVAIGVQEFLFEQLFGLFELRRVARP